MLIYDRPSHLKEAVPHQTNWELEPNKPTLVFHYHEKRENYLNAASIATFIHVLDIKN